MAAQPTPISLADPTACEAPYDRQRRLVKNYLMKIAFGDPQVHHRMHASADFLAGFNALDPNLPGFIPDEATRNVIMIGCLHMIDTTAALLRYARENDIQIVPKRQ
jgi:hypothetical protein